MGIYRTLLEEEVPHLDDNNNPDDQIKELQDVIEDHDANEAEQKAAQDAAFGPDGGVDEIMDESAIAIYEFESGHAAIMQAIGVHELQEAVVGREFIMEAADIKGFFKSVKDKIVAFFKKVWQVLQRWAGNIGAAFTSNKKFVEKYSKQISAGYDILDSAKEKMKMYEFPGIDKALEIARTTKDANPVKELSEQIVADIKTAVTNGTKVSKPITAEEVEETLEKIRGTFCAKNVSASEFSSELKKNLYGESSEGLMSVSDITAILGGKKDDRKAVKDFMTNAKNNYKVGMQEIDSAEKAVTKMKEGVERNSLISECTRLSVLVRGWMTSAQIWRNATLSAINARARQARRFGMAYVTAANKGKYKGFQKESTEYGFLGSLGLV